MSEAIGPYTKNNINWNDADESKKKDVTFWGFDEGAVLGEEDQQHKWRDSNNIRFPMSKELQESITEAFQSLGNLHPDGGDLYLKRGWPEHRDNSASSQSIKSYIEFYAEIFKDAEVIPYIYPLQIGKEGAVSGTYRNQQRGVMSSTQNDLVDPGTLETDTWYNDKIIDEITNDTSKIEMYSSFNNLSTSQARYRYVMVDMEETNWIKNQRLMKKTDGVDATKSLATSPKFFVRGGAVNSFNIGWLIKNEQDLYNYATRERTYTTAIQDSTASARWGICDNIAEVDPATLTDPKTMCAGVFTFNNANDGNYNTSNARTEIMNRYQGTDVNSSTLSTTSPHQNEYFFFVKTKKPWYTWPTNSLDEDFPAYQYWAFNINALFCPINPNGYPIYYTRGWDYGTTYRGTYWPSTITQPSLVAPGGYTGLPMVAYTRYASWQLSYLPYYFYVPFAYYLVKNLDCFEDADVLNPAYQSQECNSPSAPGNDTIYDSWPTRTGLYINAKKSQWVDFFRNHLGLYQTTGDMDELLYKNTDEWDTTPVVPVDQDTPPTPGDYQPGSGGQGGVTPAGGTGDYGTTNDPVTPNTTSTGGGRLNKAWNMNQTSVISLQECLVSNNLFDGLKTIFEKNYQQGMINLIQFPFDVTQLYSEGTLKTVKVLGVDMDFTGISNFCDGYEIPRDITTTVLWGSFDIKERFGSFNDYRNTVIDLYVPFCGHTHLQTSHCMGRRILVYMDIDFGDGSCLATVWASHNRNTWDNIEGGGFFPVCSLNGQIGTIVPLASSDGLIKTQQKAFTGIATVLGAGASIVSGGLAAVPAAAGAVGGGIGSEVSMAFHDKPDYQSGGVVNSQHTLAVTTDCVLTITYPEVDMPEDYAKIAGYTTNYNGTLGLCTGFTAADMVKLNGLACTDVEADEIKNLLSQGVVIQ